MEPKSWDHYISLSLFIHCIIVVCGGGVEWGIDASVLFHLKPFNMTMLFASNCNHDLLFAFNELTEKSKWLPIIIKEEKTKLNK